MNIAFLGIGLMGFPMARRLCEAGHTVHAWNRSRDKAERLLPFGAKVHDKAADAAREAEIVITMLENGAVVQEVLFQAGVAHAMKPGTVVVDMSSIKPAEARAHAAELFRVRARLGRFDGRHVHHHGAGLHGMGDAILEQHLLHHGAVFQHGDDDLRVARRIGGLVMHRGTKGGEPFGLVTRAVPHGNEVAGLAQAARHREAHQTNAQHRDLHHRLQLCQDTMTYCRSKESPYGPIRSPLAGPHVQQPGACPRARDAF
jgi:hypothetical protein